MGNEDDAFAVGGDSPGRSLDETQVGCGDNLAQGVESQPDAAEAFGGGFVVHQKEVSLKTV